MVLLGSEVIDDESGSDVDSGDELTLQANVRLINIRIVVIINVILFFILTLETSLFLPVYCLQRLVVHIFNAVVGIGFNDL
jgi:hypothetical protein